MRLTAKATRHQLQRLQPLLRSCSLETIRKGQNKLGELMEARYRKQTLCKEHPFQLFNAAWILPKDERRQGVVLYLHGGGYVYGDLDYAKGFGSTLAVQCGVRVFCVAYRLAPEHPAPAALDDCLTAYQYLLSKGYAGTHITLCGESAGGGLCYALCLKLKALGLPLPASVIAISPWVDLTASGDSYEANKNTDPTLTRELLDYFASSYTGDRCDPLVSPLFGDLQSLPPSLIFAGGDELLLSDSKSLHQKLLRSHCRSQLLVKPERWHAYVLYGLEEDQHDFSVINHFLAQTLSEAHKLRWLPLDNAAKIYPAARRQNWSNVYRLSATVTEKVDVQVLQSALDVTVRRFPSIGARLRRGVFWYYLQQLQSAPSITEESSYPLTRMGHKEIRQCAFRVVVYENRIAVEFFHSLTDGNGALVFLKSLVAEYLQQKYDLRISSTCGVLGRLEEPSPAELEDSFQKYAGPIQASRKENNSYRLSGTAEKDGFLHLTCFQLPVSEVLSQAHEWGYSLTVFVSALIMEALQLLQCQQQPDPRRRKPIRVLIPVNLRNIFPSQTLRNFAMYTTPEIDTRLGEYDFSEICKAIHHRMGLEVNAKQMSTKIATNVASEKLLAVKLMPLFIKNFVMKAVFNAVGERKSCLSISNLGQVKLPVEMMELVNRLDFILGTQATAPHNCGILSFKDTLYINFTRDIRESDLELAFHQVLLRHGLYATVESNGEPG